MSFIKGEFILEKQCPSSKRKLLFIKDILNKIRFADWSKLIVLGKTLSRKNRIVLQHYPITKLYCIMSIVFSFKNSRIWNMLLSVSINHAHILYRNLSLYRKYFYYRSHISRFLEELNFTTQKSLYCVIKIILSFKKKFFVVVA